MELEEKKDESTEKKKKEEKVCKIKKKKEKQDKVRLYCTHVHFLARGIALAHILWFQGERWTFLVEICLCLF